jgi:hypothetical protein
MAQARRMIACATAIMRPRLPTACREALRERRTPARHLQDRRRVWCVLLASTHRVVYA